MKRKIRNAPRNSLGRSRTVPRFASLVLLAAAFFATNGAAAAMTMTVSGDQIVATGPVVASDGEKFASLIAANPAVQAVVLSDSPGGSAEANDRMTEVIEAHHLDTVVSGFCVSACAMIFLAGTHRAFGDLVPSTMTSLGFHASYITNGALASNRRLSALRARVIERTGGRIDPALVDRWLHFTDRRNTIRFRPAGSENSVYFCPIGRLPNTGHYESCTVVPDMTALSQGIVTTADVAHVNR